MTDGIYSKTEPNSFTIAWRTTNESGVTNISKNTVNWTNTATGVMNPQWKWRVARNLPATTAFSASSRTVVVNQEAELGGGYYVSDVHIPANYRELIGRGINPPSVQFGGIPDGISDDIASQQALGLFWKDCVRARNAIQGGTLIGELSETIRMVKGRGSEMMHLFTNWNSHLRKAKRKYRLRKDRRRAAADAWLEFSFGWAPLAGDITGLLSNYTEPRREVRRVHGQGSEKTTSVVSGGNDLVVGPIIARTGPSIGTVLCEVRYKGCIAGEVPGLGGIQDRLGLLPEDFVPTLWELLPWSFLADYFTNVGDCISALCYPRGLIKWINLTTRRTTVRTVHTTYNRPSDSALQRRNTVFTRTTPGSYTATRKTVVRSNVDPYALPNQNLRLEVPGGLGKWVNMSALAAARAFKYWP